MSRAILFLTILSMFFFLPLGLHADRNWVPANGASSSDQTSLQVLTSDMSELVFEVSFDGLSARDIDTKGGRFLRLDIPGEGHTTVIGSPRLPVFNRLFEIPYGAEMNVSIVDMDVVEYNLIELGESSRILPLQEPLPKVEGASENARFVIDRSLYRLNEFLPAAAVGVEDHGYMRNHRIGLVKLNVVSYNPVQSKIRFITRATVRVKMNGGSYGVTSQAVDRVYSRPFENMLSNVLINYPLTEPMAPLTDPIGYLIITHDNFTSGLTALIDVKVARGFEVTVTPLSEISPATPTGIQAYIRDAFDTWPVPPAYVLLVGDDDYIPGFQGSDSYSITDLYYAQMNTGDYLRDLSVGRLTVRNTTQLANVIDKIVYYENNPPPPLTWYDQATFLASLDNYQISEGTNNYVIENYLEPAGITCHKIYARLGGDTQDIFDNLNEGRRICNYSGHGSQTSWYNPAFSQSNINSLTNEGMYPFVISNACLTGDFEVTECFGETWLLAANKGAIAHWGASESSYWDEDDVLEKKLWRVAFEDSVFAIGPMTDQALLELYEHYGGGGSCRYYFEIYNVLGDPSVEIYSTAPPTGMRVGPGSGLISEGPNGGPFTPDSQEYTLTNYENYPIDFTVSEDATWLDLSTGGGTIPALGEAYVTVSINPSASNLPNGEYTAVVDFVNTTNHDGDTGRTCQLTVGVPTMQYEWNMNSNPGWSTTGLWAYGQPAGGGGQYGNPDPSSGHTGNNVYGYNLNGDYENNLSERHLTSDAIDCSDLTEVSLKFWRYLNVETDTYDHAYIRVSTNGSSWTTVWENSGYVEDSSWSELEYDISSVADNQSTVYVRWTMGTTDGSWQYSGWNIDDIQIWGLAPEDTGTRKHAVATERP